MALIKLKTKSFVWKKIFTFFIYLMLFGFPFSLLVPIGLNVSTTPYSILYRSFCVFLMVILLLAPRKREKEENRAKNAFVLLMIFWAILLLRIYYDFEFTNVLKQPNVLLNSTQVYLFAIFLSLFPIIVIYKNKHFINFQYIEKYLNVGIALYALSILLGIFLNFNTNFLNIIFERTELFYGSDFGPHPLNPISISRAGSIIFLISVNRLLINKEKVLVMILFLITGLFLLLLGSSRGPFISTSIIVLILLYTKSSLKKILGLLLILFLIYLIFISFVNLEELGIFKRFESPNYGNDPTRGEIWEAALNYFLKSPLIGYSIVDKFGIYPHNIFLEVLMSIGLVGAIPFFITISESLIKSLKILSKSQNNSFALLFLCQFFFSLSSGSLYYNPEFWVLISLVLFSNKKSFYEYKSLYTATSSAYLQKKSF